MFQSSCNKDCYVVWEIDEAGTVVKEYVFPRKKLPRAKEFLDGLRRVKESEEQGLI